MLIDPWTAAGVVLATGATDAAYVRFTAAVADRKRWQAANWSGFWYLLSAFAVISYTQHWIYVFFAAIGSWLGAFLSITLMKPRSCPTSRALPLSAMLYRPTLIARPASRASVSLSPTRPSCGSVNMA